MPEEDEGEDLPQGQQPFFENQAEYLYRVLEPDAKQMFSEINKDVTTTNLDKDQIDLFQITEILVGYACQMRLPKLTESYVRENMSLVNITKSYLGFLISKMSKQEVSKNINYSMDKGYQKAMNKGG
jgi:hypothetical protein